MNASTGIKDVLEKLDDEQLFGLARTITQGLSKGTVRNREDALEVILKYSPNAVSVLRRRAITRDVLFNYLHAKNVTITLPTTKDKLIDQVCALWNIQNQEVYPQPSQTVAVSESSNDENDVSTMATKFTQWFYEMMNLNEPLETSHFFPDAVLSLNINDGRSSYTDDVCSPDDIVKLLFKAKMDHKLIFNPNMTSEGIRGVIDPHGLVVILACGTLHSLDLCVGVFEQMFSLARDPLCENNWKVKMTKINLKSTQVSEEPTLNKTSFSSALVPVKYED